MIQTYPDSLRDHIQDFSDNNKILTIYTFETISYL